MVVGTILAQIERHPAGTQAGTGEAIAQRKFRGHDADILGPVMDDTVLEHQLKRVIDALLDIKQR